jgi:hypothetical protein
MPIINGLEPPNSQLSCPSIHFNLSVLLSSLVLVLMIFGYTVPGFGQRRNRDVVIDFVIVYRVLSLDLGGGRSSSSRQYVFLQYEDLCERQKYA